LVPALGAGQARPTWARLAALPVRVLEVYDPLAAKIEAALEHRRALVETRTLMLHYTRVRSPSYPLRSATNSPPLARSKQAPQTRDDRHQLRIDGGR
jgi:hypothetical protein